MTPETLALSHLMVDDRQNRTPSHSHKSGVLPVASLALDVDHVAPHALHHQPNGHPSRRGGGVLRGLKPMGGTLQQQLGFSRPAAHTPNAMLHHLGHSLRAVHGALRPQGCTHSDRTHAERVLNIVTSLPFLAGGWHIMRYDDIHTRVDVLQK